MRHLTRQPIVAEHLVESCALIGPPGHGAAVTFLGIVRADASGGRTVEALCYEAYEEMAEREIDGLVVAATVRWPGTAVRVQHRLGDIPVGQISVAIVAAAAHRPAAYAASRFLIEGIKRLVPIWKREQYDDGTSHWVGCAHHDEVVDAHV